METMTTVTALATQLGQLINSVMLHKRIQIRETSLELLEEAVGHSTAGRNLITHLTLHS
jgi:hypothetical protein